jgi:hypothetical protein
LLRYYLVDAGTWGSRDIASAETFLSGRRSLGWEGRAFYVNPCAGRPISIRVSAGSRGLLLFQFSTERKMKRRRKEKGAKR